MLPINQAKQLPIYLYGSVKLTDLSGVIKILAPIRKGMIGFGQPYETESRASGIAQIGIAGEVVFKGHMQFGKDCLWVVKSGAYCEFGHMSSLGTKGKLICTNEIIFGDFARIGTDANVTDHNSHQMINTVTLEKYPISQPVQIGNYNFIGFRVSIMPNTRTPDYCTVASNSLCNKDYTTFGENVMIGGIPATLLKQNISRDWSGEHEMLMKSLLFNNGK